MSATANFRARTRGDNTELVVFLRRRSLQSQEKTSGIKIGDVVTLTLSPTGSPAVTLTTNPGGGLTADFDTGEVRAPLSPAVTQRLPAGLVPFRYRVVDADGDTKTWLHGVVPFED